MKNTLIGIALGILMCVATAPRPALAAGADQYRIVVALERIARSMEKCR